MNKWNGFKSDISDFELCSLFKDQTISHKIILTFLLPFFIIAYGMWVIVCLGGFFGELLFNNDKEVGRYE
jgi:hypothetical protein